MRFGTFAGKGSVVCLIRLVANLRFLIEAGTTLRMPLGACHSSVFVAVAEPLNAVAVRLVCGELRHPSAIPLPSIPSLTGP